MKFYPGDWMNDNVSLTHEEFGVYMRMAFRYWTRDGLPWTPEDIAEDIGDRGRESVETIKLILGKKFTRGRGKRWVHRDLEAARTEVREFKHEKSDDGAAGNRIKHKGADERKNKADSAQGGEGEKPIKPTFVANKYSCGTPTTSATIPTPSPAPLAPPSTPSLAPSSPATSPAPPDGAQSLPEPLVEFPPESIPPEGPERRELLDSFKKRDPQMAMSFIRAYEQEDRLRDQRTGTKPPPPFRCPPPHPPVM